LTEASSSIPTEGKRAPAFTLANESGDKVRLSALKGAPVVVYFYPKDSTSGCTVEAQEFRDLMAKFSKAGVQVFGVSPDSAAMHCKFIEKQSLNFSLLVDEGHTICEKYGLWVEKSMYGRKYWGVQRATFLIDAKGKVAKVWPKVKPKGHAAEVLEAVKAL
jgi:peroxiredoxin Q/BCP